MKDIIFYSLRKKMEGELGRILNNQLFLIEWKTCLVETGSKYKRGLRFINPVSKHVIWETTPVVSRKETPGGWVYITEDTVYDIIQVYRAERCVVEGPAPKDVLPISSKEDIISLSKKEEPDETRVLVPVTSRRIYRDRNYHDGWNGTLYTFDEEITYEEFLEFCKRQNHNLAKLNDWAWYEDHAQITPLDSEDRVGVAHHGWEVKEGEKSNVWAYIWVLAYTD